jgi:hypothetical protein
MLLPCLYCQQQCLFPTPAGHCYLLHGYRSISTLYESTNREQEHAGPVLRASSVIAAAQDSLYAALESAWGACGFNELVTLQ